jgi:predicted ester cyclase
MHPHPRKMSGLAPTGKQVVVAGINFHRVIDGNIVSEWDAWDQFGMMKQLGVLQISSPTKSS